MTQQTTCIGWPASWLNAWLAAVGATVLSERLHLSWTNDPEPAAVLSCDDGDPLEVLAGAWPTAERLQSMPIARDWLDVPMERRVPVDVLAARMQASRGHRDDWTLTSTMTDLVVDKAGEARHGVLDPAGPGTIKWLHHRLVKVSATVNDPATAVPASAAGVLDRVGDNGLGFDVRRIGSLGDRNAIFVDPVV